MKIKFLNIELREGTIPDYCKKCGVTFTANNSIKASYAIIYNNAVGKLDPNKFGLFQLSNDGIVNNKLFPWQLKCNICSTIIRLTDIVDASILESEEARHLRKVLEIDED